jgi:glycosyltransferase involved in cell wall biosynthesis
MSKILSFTVVVTTYNSENFIEQCIKSILHQNYNLKKVQLLIVDDNSKDRTVEKITNLNAQNLFGQYQLLNTKINSGPGVGRNMGISKHTGDYLIFVDSDDELLPDALYEISVNSSGMPDLIFYDSIRKYNNGDEIKYCKHMNSLNNEILIRLKTILSLESDDHVIHSAYKSSYLRNIPPFCSGFFEDIKFQAYSILQAKSIAHISNPLYLKNCHNQQITSFMDFDKGLQYLDCRISLHDELLFQYAHFGKSLESYSNFGLRGAISLTLNNMKKFYTNEEEFNLEARKVFKFLNNRINNLRGLFDHDLSSNLDFQAKHYYYTFCE